MTGVKAGREADAEKVLPCSASPAEGNKDLGLTGLGQLPRHCLPRLRTRTFITAVRAIRSE